MSELHENCNRQIQDLVAKVRNIKRECSRYQNWLADANREKNHLRYKVWELKEKNYELKKTCLTRWKEWWTGKKKGRNGFIIYN